MRWSLVLLVAALAGCNDPTAVRQVEVVAKAHADGGYHLRLWNGKTLPATIATGVPGSSATVKTEITGADLTILGSNWTLANRFRVTWVGDSVTTYTQISRGTVSGNVLFLSGGGSMTVTYTGNDATILLGGEVYVYSR